MTCLTCRHRYTSDAFGPRESMCAVYNAATEIDPLIVSVHVGAERERLGHYPGFDAVENCPAHAQRPRFITLEGPDGVGKTTLAVRLADHLRTKGRRVLLTAEPTRGPIGTLIRAAMAGDATLQPALAHLFAADRALHIATEIGPALADGLDVICDRYTLSSLAYQGPEAWTLNERFRAPDLTLLLSAPVAVRLARLSARAAADPWEQERAEAVERCYEAAAHRVEIRGWKVARIDASGTPDDTFEAALRAL